MKVSDVQITPMRTAKDGLVGFCSFILDDSIYIGSVAIFTCLRNKLGYRLVYPSKKTQRGDLIPCVYPINEETGRAIAEAVIPKYKAIVESALINEEREEKKMYSRGSNFESRFRNRK